MNNRLVPLLRGIIVPGLLGCLGIQARLIIVPVLDPVAGAAGWRTAAVTVVVLGLVCVEIALFCVRRLVTLVRRGTVFSPAAFHRVDAIIGAIAVSFVLVLIRGYVIGKVIDAPGFIPVGVVLAQLVAGVAPIVDVQRMLLVQATGCSAELDGVI